MSSSRSYKCESWPINQVGINSEKDKKNCQICKLGEHNEEILFINIEGEQLHKKCLEENTHNDIVKVFLCDGKKSLEVIYAEKNLLIQDDDDDELLNTKSIRDFLRNISTKFDTTKIVITNINLLLHYIDGHREPHCAAMNYKFTPKFTEKDILFMIYKLQRKNIDDHKIEQFKNEFINKYLQKYMKISNKIETFTEITNKFEYDYVYKIINQYYSFVSFEEFLNDNRWNNYQIPFVDDVDDADVDNADDIQIFETRMTGCGYI